MPAKAKAPRPMSEAQKKSALKDPFANAKSLRVLSYAAVQDDGHLLRGGSVRVHHAHGHPGDDLLPGREAAAARPAGDHRGCRRRQGPGAAGHLDGQDLLGHPHGPGLAQAPDPQEAHREGARGLRHPPQQEATEHLLPQAQHGGGERGQHAGSDRTPALRDYQCGDEGV